MDVAGRRPGRFLTITSHRENVTARMDDKRCRLSSGTAAVVLLLIGALHALPVDQQPTSQQQKQTPAVDAAAATTVSTGQLGGGGSSHSRRPIPAEGIEFPNTAFIPGDLTEQLSVDGFFSLWFVFLDDDVFTSGKLQIKKETKSVYIFKRNERKKEKNGTCVIDGTEQQVQRFIHEMMKQ